MRLKFVETLVDLDAGLESDRQSTGYGYDSVTIKPRHPLMSLSFYKWVNISILIRLIHIVNLVIFAVNLVIFAVIW